MPPENRLVTSPAVEKVFANVQGEFCDTAAHFFPPNTMATTPITGKPAETVCVRARPDLSARMRLAPEVLDVVGLSYQTLDVSKNWSNSTLLPKAVSHGRLDARSPSRKSRQGWSSLKRIHSSRPTLKVQLDCRNPRASRATSLIEPQRRSRQRETRLL